jgi:MoaA/NifB/PqqE/SkfB family radical SAM enzyme
MHRVLLNIELTPSCPAACSMCPRTLINHHGYMTRKTLDTILAAVDPSYVWELDFAGRGEPTVHPQFAQLAELLTSQSKGIPTCVVTTGVSFTPKNVAACNRNFDLIRLSVSSVHRATFDRVHIGLDYDHIWRNIRCLAETCAEKTIIHLTGGPLIYDALPETVDTLRSFGFSQFRLLSLWNRGGHFQTVEDRTRRKQLMERLDIPPSENEAWRGTSRAHFIGRFAYQRLLNRRFCPVGDASLSIAYDGQILGCFQDFGHTSNIGDVVADDIRHVIHERVGRLGRMPVCQQCDAHKVTLFKLL